jgi:hypothetical protein
MNRFFKLTATMLFALAIALPTFAQTSTAPAEGKAADSAATTKKEAAPKKTKKTHKKHSAKKAAAAAPQTQQ